MADSPPMGENALNSLVMAANGQDGVDCLDCWSMHEQPLLKSAVVKSRAPVFDTSIKRMQGSDPV
jgi:hypothetical protein